MQKRTIVRPGGHWKMIMILIREVSVIFSRRKVFSYIFKGVGLFDKIGVLVLFPSSF